MAQNDETKSPAEKKIVIRKNGPYIVSCGIPLTHKTQVVSEYGEPLTWKKEEAIECKEDYALCRCGQSANKPFCDGTHRRIAFDGTEWADTSARETSHGAFPAGRKIIVEKDPSLCMSSGYCGFANASLPELLVRTDDTQIRSLVIAMVERCPSGALTYRLEPDQTAIEPDLPQQIADTTEITSDGPITGPLWVTGGIPIERSDGQPFETRNRVTLCNCGHSGNKPLCDGTHRDMAQREARRRRIVIR
ncbi:MAG: CDGSH iron-sulfur domain-containing protein [Anaerolineales bacterium]